MYFEKFNDDNYNIPKIIWTYWDSEDRPKLINQILNNNKITLSEWTINILNDNNINLYIDIDKNNNKFTSLGSTHKSDLIRLKLLEKYGGIWIDASIIINSKNELEKLVNESMNVKADLTAFTLYDKDESFKYHQYIESWFLIAPVNSKIIKLWLIEFEKAIDVGFEEYNKHIVNNLKIKIDHQIYNNDYNNTYLTVYTALQYVLQSNVNSDIKILLKRSEDTMYKHLIDCN